MTQPDQPAQQIEALRGRRATLSKGRRRAMARTGLTLEHAQTGGFKHKAPALFAVRESPEYGYMLLDKMIEQTLDPYKDIPAVQVALSHGAAPLARDAEGSRLRTELNAELLLASDSSRRFFGIRFVIDGYVFQYGLTSAARKSLLGDNDWVESLSAALDQWRPEQLITGPAARLARLERFFMAIEEPLKRSRTTVRTAEVPTGLDLRTDIGELQWRALAKAAETDYRASITRLLTGVVYELKNNRYPRAAQTLVPGYRKVGGHGADKHGVRFSLEDRPLVRRFIEMCAGEHTEREMAHELEGLGLKVRHAGSVNKGKTLPSHVDDPVRLIKTLYTALPTYLDGKYLFQHEMPLPHVEDFHGIPVHRLAAEDNGYIQVALNFGTPPGGWHDEELIKAAIERRAPRSELAPPTLRDTFKPLAGLIRWREEGFEYCIHANEAQSYELRRRVVAPGAARTTFASSDGELVGRFKALLLHKAMAALLKQLQDAAPSSLPCPQARGDEALLRGLRDERAKWQLRAQRARLLMVDADDEREHRRLERKLAKAKKKTAALTTDIGLEMARLRPPPGAVMDGHRLAALIKILDDLPGPADMSVAKAVRTVVRSLRIVDAVPTHPLAYLEATLQLSTDQGPVMVGPLRAPVQNRAVQGRPGSDTRREGFARRNRRLLDLLFLGAGDTEAQREWWEAEGLTPRSYVRRLTALLEPQVGGAVTSALVHCPIVDVRRAALEPVLRHGLAPSDGLSPELAAEVAAVYAPDGFTWANGWCPGGMARERQVLAFIDRYARDPDLGLPVNVVAQSLNVHLSALHRMVHEGPNPYGRRTPSAAPWYARLELVRGEGREPSRLRVRQCPHCGGRTLLQPLRVPEVAGYLLCTNPICRRSLLSGLRYPDAFLEPWDGPQSLARRSKQGAVADQVWFSGGGRVVVGSTLCTVEVPSLHAPRRAARR